MIEEQDAIISDFNECSYEESKEQEFLSLDKDNIFGGANISNLFNLETPAGRQVFQSLTFTGENVQELGFFNYILQLRHIMECNGGIPTCEVRLQDVSCHSNSRKSFQKIPTLLHPFSMPQICKRKNEITKRYRIRNINAIFKPGTMTLILGPPGCGKTTLLKTIAGIISTEVSKNDISGTVSYNGQTVSDRTLAKLAAYVPQQDAHIPTLTVKETFEFAHYCCCPKSQSTNSFHLSQLHKVDILIKILGLDSCKDTFVGNEYFRGISGGQKKRVTLGEMIMGDSEILLMDEFSTGLDSSSTYKITKALQIMTKLLGKTSIFAMLQPSPEIYDVFDNVLVLDHGEIIYNGPQNSLSEYFRSIGFSCPARIDMADFLQEVTVDTGSVYQINSTCCKNIPQNREEFVECFKKNPLFIDTLNELESNDCMLAAILGDGMATSNEKYYLSFIQSLKVVFCRQFKISWRDYHYNLLRLVQSAFLGLVLGLIFRNTQSNSEKIGREGVSKLGLIFLFLMFQALATFSSVQQSVELRYILYRQSWYKFFPEITLVLAETVIELCWMILQTSCFVVPLYLFSGLNLHGIHCLVFWVYAVIFGIIYYQLYKLCALLAGSASAAKVLCGFTLLIGMVFSGFIISEENMPTWWIWIFWSNPVSWAFRGLALNEYVCEEVNDVKRNNGLLFTKHHGIHTDCSYINTGILYLSAVYVCLIMLTTLAYQHIRHFHGCYTERTVSINETNSPRKSHHSGAFFSYESNGSTTKPNKGFTITSLMFTPVVLAIVDIKYSIEVDNEVRYLLQAIHAIFKPGTMTALMGPSGAGKTTLLDVVAGRKSLGKIEGDMFMNGSPLNRKDFNLISAYVEQSDVHMETATVREALHFSANLRLSSDLKLGERKSFVEEVIDTLCLTNEADFLISSLSLGLKKRLTIGVEMVSNPSVIFLDEPTSGLDAFSASKIMESIKRIADSGRTVICTIHQPNTTIFESFDSLLLLKTGGEIVYFGELGPESSHLVSYFEDIPHISKIKAHLNPATYVLDILQSNENNVEFAKIYSESALCLTNLDEIVYWSEAQSVFLDDSGYCRINYLSQFWYLFQRTLTKYWRSPVFNLSRVFIALSIAMLFGSLFSNHSLESSVDVISHMNAIYNACTDFAMVSMLTGLPVMFADRAVFYREKSSKMYATICYLLSLALVELLYSFATGTLFTFALLWALELNTSFTAISWLLLVNVLDTLFFMYFGFFMVFLSPNLHTAIILLGGSIAMMLVFAGFIITGEGMPVGWMYIYRIFPLSYVVEILMVTQFFNDTRNVSSPISAKFVTIKATAANFFENSFSYDHRYMDLYAIITWIVVLQICSYLCLRFLNHVKK